MSGYSKNSGFTKKPHAYQIFSYLFFLSKVVAFTAVVLPLNELIPAIILSIFYYLSVICMAYFGYKCTSSDPTDEVVIRTREAEAKGENFDTSRYDFYCATCRSSVQDNSKHCWPCNRCVSDFDHHCKWVNNCISKKNYNLIASVAVSMLIFCCAALIAIIRYARDPNNLIISTLWYKSLSFEQLEALFLIICVEFGLNALFLVLDIRLISFHIWLIRRKLTTYEYIKIMREKQENKLKDAVRGKAKSKKSKIHAIIEEKGSPEANNDDSASSPMPQNEKIWNDIKNAKKTPELNVTPINAARSSNPTFRMEVTRIEIPQGKFSNPGSEPQSPNIMGENHAFDHRRETGSMISNKHDVFASPKNQNDSLLGKKTNAEVSSNENLDGKKHQSNKKSKGIRLAPIDSKTESNSIELAGSQRANLKSSGVRMTEPNE